MRTEYKLPPEVQQQIDRIEERRTYFRPDAAIRRAVSGTPSPETAYEIMRKVRDSSDLLQRLEKEIDYAPQQQLGATLLELLAGDQITETGVRRLLEQLKFLKA